MMKRLFLAILMLAATLPAAVNLQAQDDDIYFSKKASKKASHEAIYAVNAADEWSTNANNDWDLDSYNRRGTSTSAVMSDVIEIGDGAPFYYNVIDEKGDTVKVAGTDKMQRRADGNKYKIEHDTVVLVEQYYFSDLIRRFHNPFFGYYRYSPWYDVAYYDPFYWDYCYYDPWWYVTPSFGFHWGSWYGGWNYGYYTGWYGGWYSPYYSPCPHYFGYHGGYYDGPIYNYASGSAHRGTSRNSFGGHFAHRGGWKGDGGSTRIASASSNRSYRAANGARTGLTRGDGKYTAGPTLRGRNMVNGRMANSNMRSNSRGYDHSSSGLGGTRSNSNTSGSYSRGSHSANRVNGSTANNSNSRRYDQGVRQRDNGTSYSRSNEGNNSVYRNSTPSRSDNSSYRSNSSNTRSNSSYSNSSTRSNSSFGSSSHSSGGGFSGGSSHSGGSHSGGGHSGGGSRGRR